MIEPMVNVKRAAELLGVQPGTLGQWRHHKRHELPYIKVGGRVMYRVRDLQAFLDSRTHSA